jgi:endothelin-converting enzyme
MLELVANIIQKVGYSTVSPNVMDPNSLRDWYASMKISDNYFQNGIEYNKFNYNKAWNDLLKPVDKTRWSMTMPEVNAYYNPSFNEIVFPAGIMQLPAFGLGLPEYVSYGAFGAAAGHELSHGFDNSGSLYDQTGRLTPWWDNKTLANFGTRTQCFIDQFNKFTVPGLEPNETLHVNGKLTQGENIADTGGLTTAYRAWRMRDKANSNPGLPGLEEYTNDQLFFISYANSWCGKMRNAQQVKIVLTNEHSPYQFRINGALANSGAFREAFNCPVKQPTCELW